MKILILDPYNNKQMQMLEEYEKNLGRDIYYIEELRKNIKNKAKEEYIKDKELSIEISEILFSIKNNQIMHTCSYRGMKDNRLIEMEIDGITTSEAFFNEATNYAFERLDAETVTIFSNELKEDLLRKMGYEPLGEVNGFMAYIKDRQKAEKIGSFIK